MTNFKEMLYERRKIISVFFTILFSFLVVATLVYSATTIGTNIQTGGQINATGSMALTGASTFYATSTWNSVGADLVVKGVSTSTFDGNVALLKVFEVGNAGTSSTLRTNSLSVAFASASRVGKFYVDSNGNVSASGTLYGGGNNLADIGAVALAWKNVFASGTVYANVVTVGSTGTSSSTLGADTLMVGGTSGFNSGKFQVNSSGNIYTSGTLMVVPSQGNNLGKFYVDTSGNMHASGTLETYGALEVAHAAGYDVGKFYVDTNGNVSASGTLYGGGNNLADIGAVALAWKNVFASGTVYANVITVGSTGTASSTLGANVLHVGGTSGYNSGKFEVNSSGNIYTSGTLSIAPSEGENLGKFYVDTSGNTSASGTLTVGGNTAIKGTGTSTFAGDTTFYQTGATTTVTIGGGTGTMARGGCIALKTSTTSTTSGGLDHLYLVVIPNRAGDVLMLATSTQADNCY